MQSEFSVDAGARWKLRGKNMEGSRLDGKGRPVIESIFADAATVPLR